MALSDDLRNMTQALQNFVNAQSSYANTVNHTQTSMQRINDEMDVYNAGLKDASKLTKRQNEIQEKMQRAHKSYLEAGRQQEKYSNMIAAANTRLSTLTAGTQEYDNVLQDLSDYTRLQTKFTEIRGVQKTKRDKLEVQLNNSTKGMIGSLNSASAALTKMSNLAGPFGKLGGAANTLVSGFTSISGAFSLFSIVLSQSLNYLKVVRDVSEKMGGVLEGTNFTDSMTDFTSNMRKQFLDPTLMAEASMSVRQVTNSMGGFQKGIDLVHEAAMSQTMKYGGDITKAHIETLKQMDMMSRLGFKPTIGSIDKFNKKLNQFSMVGFSNIDQSIKELLTDSSSMVMLKNARDGEREAIKDSQIALLEYNASLGMGEEQALAAAKALGALKAATPMDRYKKAMKMKVYSGMLGMGEVGDMLYKEMIKQPGQENKQLFAEGMTKLTNATNRLEREKGFMGSMPFFKGLESLDLKNEFGDSSPFSNALVKHLGGPLEQLAKTFTDANGSFLKLASDTENRAQNMLNALQDGTGAVWALHDVMKASAEYSIGAKLSNWSDSLSTGISEMANLDVKSWFSLFGEMQDRNYDNTFGAANKAITNLFTDAIPEEKVENKQPLPTSKSTNAPTKKTSEEVLKEKQDTDNYRKTANNSDVLITNSDKTVNKLDTQITHAANTNDYLKQLVVGTTTIIDLAQKQLVASTTFGDEQKRYADYLRRSGGNGLSAEYQHV